MIKLLNTLENKPVLSYLFAIFIGIFIFYISSKSFLGGSPGPDIPFKSYIYHFSIFALFNLFLFIAITKGKINNTLMLFFVFFLSISYAISDEIHQYFVQGRYCAYSDALLDSIGILFSGIFYIFIKRK